MKFEKQLCIHLCETLCLCVFVAENAGMNAEIFFRFHMMPLFRYIFFRKSPKCKKPLTLNFCTPPPGTEDRFDNFSKVVKSYRNLTLNSHDKWQLTWIFGKK